MDSGWLCCVFTIFLSVLAESTVLQVPLQDLNYAIEVAEDFVSKLQRLEENLAVSGIEVREDTPSHGQLLDSYPTQHSLQLGKYGMIVDRASLYLLQKHCQRSRFSRKDCLTAMRNWNMSDTHLEDKCSAYFGTFKCEETQTYRSYDGSCNHLSHPSWGSSSTAYKRLLPADYSDGVSQPRRSVNKKPLPSSRLVSSILIPDFDKPEKDKTLALVQWTEFIGNDLFHTPVSKMIHVNKAIECCRTDGKALSPRYTHPICQPISIPFDDPDYAPHRTVCMNYVRSLTSLRDDCSFGPADQMNQNTHYLDGSMIYGSSAAQALSLRAMKGGKLLTVTENGEEFLPVSDNPEHCQENGIFTCYKSGDLRVNQHPHHTAMYTLWLREHNRIAGVLSVVNPHWHDETIYQETRKIVIAEIQHITYRNWIPVVLGEKYARGKDADVAQKGFTTTYSEEVDPRVSNAFATVGLRFINSMFQSQLMLYDEARNLNDSLLLKNYFNKPDVIQKMNALERLVRGLSMQTSQKMDAAFIKDVTNYLFRSDRQEMGQDVVSLDIQRGRDHGIPSYNAYRKYCGFPTAATFDDFLDSIPSSNLDRIKRVYSHPDDVDLFVGAIAETAREDGLLGPVFRCLIAEQMTRTRTGDRFFYDVKGKKTQMFKEGQMKELKRVTLARVICDNVKGIKKLQKEVFRLPSVSNPLINCEDSLIPKLNLNEWKTTK